jgi:hypothetical protein
MEKRIQTDGEDKVEVKEEYSKGRCLQFYFKIHLACKNVQEGTKTRGSLMLRSPQKMALFLISTRLGCEGQVELLHSQTVSVSANITSNVKGLQL